MLCAGAARAQQPDDAAAARQHYDRGMGHFQLEEWDAAIDEWKEGFRIKPVGEFLYNIAQAYRLSKRNEQAVSFYQKYLRVDPKASNRGEVEKHITQLNKLIEAQKQAQSAPPIQPLPNDVKAERTRPQPPVVATTATDATRPRPIDHMPTETRPQPPPDTTPPPTTTIVVAPVTPPPTTTLVATPPPPPAQPIYKKGWFWGVVGGAVVVIVGAAVAGAVLAGGDSTKTLPAARF
jgi:tetratricopeptide (TPR) repeat protein